MNDRPVRAAVRVRTAMLTDTPAVARIRVEGWRAAYPTLVAPDVLARLDEKADAVRFAERMATRPDVHLLVADLDGDVVGFCTYGADRDEARPGRAEIYAIYVQPEVWRSGAGTALLESTFADLDGQGVTEVRLWVLTGNAQARRFYERQGFRSDDTEQELPGLLDPVGATVREVRYVLAREG
jgi:ribosomal protein S18 acetylase RimI-like enzyme